MEIDPDILRYYSDEWDEDARLRSGLEQLELIRTRELVRRHLPPGPLRILDVGGGSGVHAEWLLRDGHAVDLVDPVALHIEQATATLGSRARFTARVGDARDLGGDDGRYDAVLLLGPLYHLTERADRLRSLREARRVARPGGVVVAAAITRFASLFAGLTQGDIFEESFRTVVGRDLADGQHRNVPGRDYFTTAYFHHPDDLAADVADAGLERVGIFAVEGPVGAIPGLATAWDDPQAREVILDSIRLVEREPSLLGIGPHLLAVATVP